MCSIFVSFNLQVSAPSIGASARPKYIGDIVASKTFSG